MYKKFVKRLIDIVLSACGIVVLAPVWLILAIAIKIDDPGPVFFRQKRIAQDKNGEKQFFQIYKYRSMKMCTPKDCPTHLLENPEQYITKVGGFLRKTSLDELPQILNIFKGEMSIIGPRPALWNQYDLIALREAVGANDVRPGLTGLAQVNGRNALSWEQKFAYDLAYVEDITLRKDLAIMFDTVQKVVSRADISVDTQQAEGNLAKIRAAANKTETFVS